MLPALRTRIAHRELPIFLDFHEARPSDGWTGMLWPPSIRATVDAEVELVKPLTFDANPYLRRSSPF